MGLTTTPEVPVGGVPELDPAAPTGILLFFLPDSVVLDGVLELEPGFLECFLVIGTAGAV